MHELNRFLQLIRSALILIALGMLSYVWLQQRSGQLPVPVPWALAGLLSGFVLLGAVMHWLLQTRPVKTLTWLVMKLLNFIIEVCSLSMYFTLIFLIVLMLIQAIGRSSPKASFSSDLQPSTSDPANQTGVVLVGLAGLRMGNSGLACRLDDSPVPIVSRARVGCLAAGDDRGVRLMRGT